MDHLELHFRREISWRKLKHDSKLNKRILLRFEKGVTGYKFLNQFAHQVVISGEVVFDEKTMIKAFRKEEYSQEEGSNSGCSIPAVHVELEGVKSLLDKEPRSSD